jgi:hypothetical protein
LSSADVFDLYVFETVSSYHQYQEQRQRLEQGEVKPADQGLLQSIMNRVKGADDGQ